jgi:hypothetical protein
LSARQVLFARIADSKVSASFVLGMGLLYTAVTTAEGIQQLTVAPPHPSTFRL